MRDAVIADCKAYNKMGDVNYPLAAKYLVDIDGGHTVKYMGGRSLDLCRRVWNVFYTEGRVGEAWRRGAAPLISREDALKIAAQLKGGKQGYTIRGGRRWPRCGSSRRRPSVEIAVYYGNILHERDIMVEHH